jgi:hypothetical protein
MVAYNDITDYVTFTSLLLNGTGLVGGRTAHSHIGVSAAAVLESEYGVGGESDQDFNVVSEAARTYGADGAGGVGGGASSGVVEDGGGGRGGGGSGRGIPHHPYYPYSFSYPYLLHLQPNDSAAWNASWNVSDEGVVEVEDPLFSALVGTILTGVVLCTVTGNVMVLLAVFVNSHLRSTTNYFIVNLAIADLLLGTTVLPFSASLEVHKVGIRFINILSFI